jgi:hypothetical protein
MGDKILLEVIEVQVCLCSVSGWNLLKWLRNVEIVEHYVIMNAKKSCLCHVCRWATLLPYVEVPWEPLLIILHTPLPWSHPW